LLELPDEALELIERRELSEGHGRALLLAEDQSLRRSLARAAAAGGWSVRELEARARTAAEGDRRRPRSSQSRPALHPDQEAAIAQIGDVVGRALGREVDVRPARHGYRVELRFESIDDA